MTAPSCRVCGRLLRSEPSKTAGVGPVCKRRSQPHTAPRITTPTPADNHHPGQLALNLNL